MLEWLEVWIRGIPMCAENVPGHILCFHQITDIWNCKAVWYNSNLASSC